MSSWWIRSRFKESILENTINEEILNKRTKMRMKMKKEEKKRRDEEKKLEKEIRKMRETTYSSFGMGDDKIDAASFRSMPCSTEHALHLGESFQLQNQFRNFHRLVVTKPPCSEESPSDIVYPVVSSENGYKCEHVSDDSAEESRGDEDSYDDKKFNRYFKQIYEVNEYGELKESESREFTVVKEQDSIRSVQSDNQSIISCIKRFTLGNRPELSPLNSRNINNNCMVPEKKVKKKTYGCVLL
ncbi:uncharacterized protein LOC111624698 [Centruroides sculpturatus]|uniref:uncharacterized protein LOC111624697 n=1 Tax=Centruroides sculpturatus TaxID=218467 RepID=UPI000C6DB4A5|nr:uncharacterized protein LOC111624697 [Centruroides sculpturatus]XP_023223378.1 uncharacterized protein LOC111624698 [Centruroides sculpturatus]